MKKYNEKTNKELLDKINSCNAAGITNGQIFDILDVMQRIKRV